MIEIASGNALTTPIENCAGSVVWNADSDGFAYRSVNENWRPDKALYRSLHGGDDTVLYQEEDDAFFVGLGLSQSEQLMFITERRSCDQRSALRTTSRLACRTRAYSGRREGHEYDVEHQGTALEPAG